MSEKRAKLIYNGVRYYDSDLVKIGKKEAEVIGRKYMSYSISRKTDSVIYSFKLNGNMESYNLPFTSLNFYHKSKGIGKVIEDKKDEKSLIVSLCDKSKNIKYKKAFTDRDIMAIGKIVANDMNSLCKSFVVNEQTKSIEYKCKRGNLDFTINVKFNDLNAPELSDIGKIIK